MVMSNKILSYREIHCFHCLVPIIYYLIQKTINTNSFHGLVPIIQGNPENRELSSPCQPVLFYI